MAERHWADHGDVDGDGLSDEFEMNVVGTNPLNPDTDGDGLWDNRERDFGSSPLSPDTDGDHVPDLPDVIVGSSPYMADTDWDGTSDYDEIRANTAWAPDFDGDGTPEWVEQVREHRHLDGDGLSTGDELWLRTNGWNDDTDGDGMGDMYEVAVGRDPRVADPPERARRRVPGWALDTEGPRRPAPPYWSRCDARDPVSRGLSGRGRRYRLITPPTTSVGGQCGVRRGHRTGLSRLVLDFRSLSR